MRQRVSVTVSGLQETDVASSLQEAGNASSLQGAGCDGVPVESEAIGVHYEKNGRHYVLFEERMEGFAEPVKNLLKLGGGCLEVERRGTICTHMTFAEGKEYRCIYKTPYGGIGIEMVTKMLTEWETGEGFGATAEYALKESGNLLADCRLTVDVRYLNDLMPFQ